MLNSILKDLFIWLYDLFLNLISYCANALLGVMTTDLTFFETSVPVIGSLYGIMRAVGWGLLIGNCTFQAMRAMCAGLGFESENPAVLLIRTGIYGFLLIFSRSICDICLSIGGKVIELVGIPENISLQFPTDAAFEAGDASWLLVIIIGFVLGFQLIKLFFEIGERYVVVAVLTLMCPVGLAMGGSKTTKDICTGYLRCFGSMILLMVMNVVFLKLILSGLSAMPEGALVLPWCVLLTGIARVARKADNLLAKIGLNPATTGDPLGHGGGKFVAMMAARSIINSAMHYRNTGGSNSVSSRANSDFKSGANTNHGVYNTRNSGNTPNSTGNTTNSATTGGKQNSNYSNRNNTQSSANISGSANNETNSNANVRNNTFANGGTGNMPGGNTRVNTNRFGSGPVSGTNNTAQKQGGKSDNAAKMPSGKASQPQTQKTGVAGNQKGAPPVGTKAQNKNPTSTNFGGRFGCVRSNTDRFKANTPKAGALRINPNNAVRFGQSVKPPDIKTPPIDTEEKSDG